MIRPSFTLILSGCKIIRVEYKVMQVLVALHNAKGRPDLPGALWPLAPIDSSRETGPPDRPSLKRVLIGVDPPLTADGDECGIVACGLGRDGIARVLGDHSVGGLSPEQWARKVAGAVEAWSADRVVAEGNSGGEMVDAVLRGAGLRLKVRRVFAKSGKARRAEPIAAFFESGEAKLAGHFPELEKQLAGLVLGGDYQGPGRSPTAPTRWCGR